MLMKVVQEQLVDSSTEVMHHRLPCLNTFSVNLYTIPALDYLISEVLDRFLSRLTATLTQIMILLPSSVAESTHPLTSTDISDLLSIYKNDLPTPSSLETELHCWSVKWKGKTQEASGLDNPLNTLSTIDDVFFPNIKKLFRITCTLPVTSAECEHSISRLHYLKTYLRSTMFEEHLNGSAMLYTEIFLALLMP